MIKLQHPSTPGPLMLPKQQLGILSFFSQLLLDFFQNFSTFLKSNTSPPHHTILPSFSFLKKEVINKNSLTDTRLTNYSLPYPSFSLSLLEGPRLLSKFYSPLSFVSHSLGSCQEPLYKDYSLALCCLVSSSHQADIHTLPTVFPPGALAAHS